MHTKLPCLDWDNLNAIKVPNIETWVLETPMNQESAKDWIPLEMVWRAGKAHNTLTYPFPPLRRSSPKSATQSPSSG